MKQVMGSAIPMMAGSAVEAEREVASVPRNL